MVNCKKLLAMFLIFTLTFSNFAFAANGFISLFGNSKGNENIEFSAYLASGEEESNALVSDVNNKDLSIEMQLEVKDKGYLKDAQIQIVAEDDEELNFKIKEESKEIENDEEDLEKKEEVEPEKDTSNEKEESGAEEEISGENEAEEIETDKEASEENETAKLEDSDNKIQSIEDNTIKLRKIESSSDKIEIALPIEYNQEAYINDSKLLTKTKVILSGIYVDKDGDENEISNEVELTLAWKDDRQVRVDDNVTKYVKFGDDGIILQTMVKVDSSTENNSLPVKATELNIDVPTINEVAPTEVTVLANSTRGTNGKGVGEVDFNTDNWTYNEEEKKITVQVENKKELVKVNESEEYLKEDEEVKEEERYFSESGIDEYVVTYVYRNVEQTDEINVTTKAQANVTIFSGVVSEENEIVVSSQDEKTFALTGQTGDIVSYDIENKNESVSKVYGYLEQETEFNLKTAINVSLTDLVEEIRVEDVENYYIDKEGNSLATDDIYYKEISVGKEDFEEILSEDGSIEILNQDGNVLATINKDMEVDENGTYVVNFEERFSKIIIKTSAPVKTGNLIISSKKAMSNLNVDKNTYANMLEIATDTVQRAKLKYVSELAELDRNTVKIALNDTKTNFNLIIDRNSLSTVTTNSDVEMRLEFNNDEEESDIYGDSVFEVEMPAYVTNVEVTNASMVNGEGLELSNVETYSRDGKIIIKMTVNGQQTALNSGVLTNGTNIVLNMNIDVDKYTPSKDDVITTYGYNSQATDYTDLANYTINDVTTSGISELDISYSGPSGVVAINSLSNYNDEGKVLTSVKEGSKTDYLEIYDVAKNAKSEIVVINNNENAVSNFSILGRLPYKGVKDVDSENELGTTVDAPLASMIAGDDGFTIYYSDKEEATKDLENEENNWVTEPESMENIKSYLIVPSSEDYKLGAKEVLRFSYDYTIPENLEHNEKIYGTFLVYYENDGIEEASRPDLVGLSTGAGPELSLEVSSDKEQVKELDEFTIKAKVTNTGEDLANNVKLIVPVPAGTTYVSAKSDRDSAEISYENGEVVASMVRLEKDISIQMEVKLKVNEVSNDEEENRINVSAKVNADNLRKEKIENLKEINIITSELSLREYSINSTVREDSIVKIQLYAENRTNTDKENVVVKTKLPEELDFSSACMIERVYDERGSLTSNNFIDNANYDSTSNEVSWKLGTVKPDENKKLELRVKANDLEDGVLSKNITVESEISADNTETYKSEDVNLQVGDSSLSIVQNSSTPTYIQEGDLIDYTFTIKNSGVIGENVELEDIVPNGVVIKKITINNESSDTFYSNSAKANVLVPANQEVTVSLTGMATNLGGEKEKTVTNEAQISSANSKIIKSNAITHIIQIKPGYSDYYDIDTNNNSNSIENQIQNEDITKSYKITGTAWLDTNKNGMRDSDESKMSDITAMLVDSNTGVIKATTKTNNIGEYTFAGLGNGTYIVIFKYNTKLYTTTTYKKDNVDEAVNSDVVTTKIEQDGKKENAAVTDTISINGSSVSGIDIGLVDATKFSLGLDKSITKVTVQNEQGTKTEKYNKAKLAKYEIRAKYLTGSTVYVEYTYTVTNNGDLAGYATEIVDYIPEGMTFNSSLNKDWYTGTDGNLYTKALENSELNVGESKEVKLILTKQMTEENTGIVSNTAEIASDYNIYGVSDDNSTPANKAQNEDDMSTADVIISVGTGESLIYISAIIVSLLLASGIGFILYKRLLENKSKGGV